MHEGIKIALDPTPSQIKGLRQHAGAARFAY
ncbi:helix-turn-helix domain-containing protein, partial [uncultured Faecalibaculum sp.]